MNRPPAPEGAEWQNGLLALQGHRTDPTAVPPGDCATPEVLYAVTREDVWAVLEVYLPSDSPRMDPDEFDRLCERVARALNNEVPSIIEGAISEHLTLLRAYPVRV